MASSAGTGTFARPKRLRRGASSKKIVKTGSVQDPDLDLAGLSSVVSKPAVRRKIYSEARSLLGDAKNETQELSSKVLFQQAASSVRESVRKASFSGLVVDQLARLRSAGSGSGSQASNEVATSAAVCRLSATSTSSAQDEDHSELEAEEDEAERLRRRFLQDLEEVKQILERIDLSDTVEEVSNVLHCVRELEAMMVALASSDLENTEVVAGAKRDVEEQVQHALEMATKKIPSAVEAISRSRSPNTSQLATNALRNIEDFKPQRLLGAPCVNLKKTKGQGSRKREDQEQAPERRLSRDQLRQKLRSNAFHGWTPLPPPVRSEPAKPDERSRESWLQWWSHEEGDGLDRRENFFAKLPPNKLTLMEMELRDAIIDFLEQRKSEDNPTWDEIRVQPMVVECTKKALPHFVTLEEWLHRRQRLSNQGIVAWPPPPPVWHLEPSERWRKDPPAPPIPETHSKTTFQRRDSTQRRGSSVFGVNFQVTEHGQIFGTLAGDEEALCELPWPCSSVVPEQKNFRWIKDSGARGTLPSVASPQRNMTVEDVMAWRLSHRFRHRRVEPVLQSMWQALSKQRMPKTCKCEHCNGSLQYQITLANDE